MSLENRVVQVHNYSDNYSGPKQDIAPHNDFPLVPTPESLNMSDNNQRSLSESGKILQTSDAELISQGEKIAKGDLETSLIIINEKIHKGVKGEGDDMLATIEKVVENPDLIKEDLETKRQKSQERNQARMEAILVEEDMFDAYSKDAAYDLARCRPDLTKATLEGIRLRDDFSDNFKRRMASPDVAKHREFQVKVARTLLVSKGHPIPGDNDGSIAAGLSNHYGPKLLESFAKTVEKDAAYFKLSVEDYLAKVVEENKLINEVKATNG